MTTLSYRVSAYNTAHDSENKIHDDAVARKFGFTGALVPGVDVYAYMMHLPVAQWGRAFLERGASECKFTSPVYDGDEVELSADEDGGVLTIEVASRGARCAWGTASLLPRPDIPVLEGYPRAVAPDAESRPKASEATLKRGVVLGTQHFEASADFLQGYLKNVREAHDLYLREGLVHPGNILRMANFALFRNVRLGPWIHVGSRVQHLSLARAGETLAARARVIANYEKKGHRFVELDVLVLANERPVAQVLHTAIYQPRQAERAA